MRHAHAVLSEKLLQYGVLKYSYQYTIYIVIEVHACHDVMRSTIQVCKTLSVWKSNGVLCIIDVAPGRHRSQHPKQAQTIQWK